MLDPIFSRRHRVLGAYDIPHTPTNTERMQAYRAIAPVQFANTRFNSPLKDEQPRRAASPTRP